MKNSIYTAGFQAHQENFEQAQENFDKKPCTETATILSNLRATKFSEEEMYTPEEITQRVKREKEKDEKFLSTLRHYASTIAIEELRTNEKTRVFLHKMNDNVNPIDL